MLKSINYIAIIAAIFLLSCQDDTIVRSDSGDFRGTYHAELIYADRSDSSRIIGGSVIGIMEFKGAEFALMPDGPRESWPPCAGTSGEFLLPSPDIIRFSRRATFADNPCQDTGQYFYGEYRIEKMYQKINLHRLDPPEKCFVLIELIR